MSIDKGRPVRLWVLAACAAAALGLPLSAAAQPYSRIVVFGDSLSDPGNAFALLGTVNTPPNYYLDPFLIPNAPYARGGHHFQNGATWVEQLAQPVGLAGSVQPAFQLASPGATNFAVGGARARNVATGVNVPAQVQAFLQQSGGAAPSDALYVIAVGGNDVRDALVAFGQGEDGGAIVQAALTSIGQQVVTLHAAGARRFLIWNAPDIGRTPAVRSAGMNVAQFATQIAQFYNATLAGVLTQLSALPSVEIVAFDTFGLINEIVTDPSSFGFANVTSPCLVPSDAPFVCQRPDDFLFWDGIHPTKATHAIIASRVASLLSW